MAIYNVTFVCTELLLQERYKVEEIGLNLDMQIKAYKYIIIYTQLHPSFLFSCVYTYNRC